MYIITDAVELMRTHAPGCVRDDIDRVITHSCLGSIVSILLNEAVGTGALSLPPEDDKDPLAFYAIVE